MANSNLIHTSLRRDYRPIEIGTRLVILPPDTPAPADKLILRLERGAFGSGEHETTHSCLELILEQKMRTARVLDLGSGTGILALACLRCGADQCWCIDVDPAAVASCQRNSQLNGLEHRLQHYCGTLEHFPQDNFDFVVANIYGDILLDIAVDLAGRLRPGGRLLLSGILWEYNYEVRRRYQKLGFNLLKNRMLDEFSTVLLEKKFKT
ncbi:MAG: methyltransferase [Deltaproteobacteria bacterium]|nr:methyltransferase [Deltaproteobacteria bacterium]NCP02831.1 methyltransferase [Deltaproteobacteria bacterium]NCP77920.1 methyltransferase [Desulfuromonadales bacterium]